METYRSKHSSTLLLAQGTSTVQLHTTSTHNLFSTGGLIALGLGAKNWTVETCIHHFESLCRDAFTPRKGLEIPGLGFFVQSHHGSKYETQPLQDALKAAYSENESLFGGPRNDNNHCSTKVGVTATSSTAQVMVITNYNRLEPSGNKGRLLWSRSMCL